jgi:hypothetical protein
MPFIDLQVRAHDAVHPATRDRQELQPEGSHERTRNDSKGVDAERVGTTDIGATDIGATVIGTPDIGTPDIGAAHAT